MRQYFYIDSKREQQGPFSIEELKERGVNKETMVWYEGLESWIKASELEELSFLMPPNPFQYVNVKEDSNAESKSSCNIVKENRKKPDNWLALSIISTILCCWPFGIPAIVYSSKVDNLWNNGDYEGAEKSAKNAKTWSLVSIFTAVGFWILYVIFFVFMGIASGISHSAIDF